MVTINIFLNSDDKTVFLEKESDYQYTKKELDGEFQFTQDCGFVTIQEYYDNLKDFLIKFKKKVTDS